MVDCWLLFPLLTLLVSLGLGLLVEAIGGWQLPGATVLSVGLAAVIVLVSVLTDSSTTAPASIAAVVVAAVLGIALGRRRLRQIRPDGWLIAAGLLTYIVCALPMVLSGNTSFLGYFVLNDGSFHFSLIQHILAHGHALPTGPPSSYTGLLDGYLATNYPVGADVAIGALHPLVGQNPAWLFSPFQAVVMGLGATVLYALWETTIAYRPLRALAAFIAGQAGLLYAYYLQASIKELTSAWLITLTVALVFATLRRGMSLRGWVALGVAVAAGIEVIGPAIAPYLVLPVLVFLLTVVWRLRHLVRGRRPSRRVLTGAGAGLVVVVAVLALFVDHALKALPAVFGVLTDKGVLGNLGEPLHFLEMVGIWPSGDFRFAIQPQHDYGEIAYVLIWLAVASGVTGILWALWRRHWPPLLLLASIGLATGVLLPIGDPYADGKVMMIFSLASIATAMLGPVALWDVTAGVRGRSLLPEAWLVPTWGLAVLIAGGVLWTNLLQYKHAAPAPRGRLQQLVALDHRYASQGPTLYNLSDEYAAYFLRNTQPTDPALSQLPLRPGQAPIGRNPVDINNLPLAETELFSRLVIGNSPLASRPPANYVPVRGTTDYSVWRRTSSPHVLAHIPLGYAVTPTSRASCRTVHRAAHRAARLHAKLAYVAAQSIPTFNPIRSVHGTGWLPLSPNEVAVRGSGFGSAAVDFPHSGRYRIEVDGNIDRRLQILVDGRVDGSITMQLGPAGQITYAGTATVSAGRHEVVVRRVGNSFTPGADSVSLLGPVLFVSEPATPPAVHEIAPSRAGALCGRELNWIELVR